MARLHLSLLGPPQIVLDGQPVAGFESSKVRALLVYLAVEADRPHSRDALAGLLWPEQPNGVARNNLRQALANLRHAIGDPGAQPPFLHISREAVQFNQASDFWLDMADLNAYLDACDRHTHGRPEVCTPCAERLTAAATMYRGNFLDGFLLQDSVAFEEWALIQREALQRRELQALHQLAAYHERRGAYDAAYHYAWRQLELDQWREEAHRQVMRVLALRGERNAALAQYERCRRLLREEFGIEPTEATTTLYERLREEAGEGRRTEIGATPLLMPSAPAHTPLPIPPTPSIGREAQVAAIRDLLTEASARLLTLIGPPGIGKTRLAIQAASALQYDFADGVCFVALAPLTDPALVIGAVQSSLGLTESSTRPPLDSLRSYLRDRQLLLVLDNFEQVGAASPLVADLLASSPQLHVLVTSRAPLNVRGERQFVVPALSVPDGAALPDVSTLLQYEAVHLFCDRALEVQSDFLLTPDNALAVVSICRRLDGLPLAIELAAARVAILTPAALLERLHGDGHTAGLRLLTGGGWDLPPHQQTLQAAIAWSHALLTPDAQIVFRRLAVFVGGSTLEAADAVVGDPRHERRRGAVGDGVGGGDHVPPVNHPLSELDIATYLLLSPHSTLDSIGELVSNSLLRRRLVGMSSAGVGEGGEFRLEMLEMIREYAWEQLEASGEATVLRHRHAAYFQAWVEQATEPLFGATQGEWAARLEHDHANLRAVLQAALDQGKIETALRLGAALSRFWILRDHISEGRRWLDAALTRSSQAAEDVRGPALLQAGMLAAIQGDSAAAVPLLEESVALYTRLEDKGRLALALTFLGMAVGQEDVARAAVLWQESLEMRREIGDTFGIAQSLMNLGFVASREGDYGRAIQMWEESMALRRLIGDRFGIAMLFKALGFAALQQSEHTQARRLLQEGLVLFREAGSKVQMADCLVITAMLAAARKRPEQTARFLGAANALLDASGASLDSMFHFGAIMDPLYYREYESSLAVAHIQLGPERFATIMAATQSRPPEQAIEEALKDGD